LRSQKENQKAREMDSMAKDKDSEKKKKSDMDKKSDSKVKKSKKKTPKTKKTVISRSRIIKVKSESKSLLKVRKKVKKVKPGFKRQEGYRMAKLKKSWRRPRGRHSKLRKSEKAKGSKPSPGYGSPKSVKGLTRYGYIEVRVSSPRELDGLNHTRDAILISSVVGRKKREEIIKKAQELKIYVVNQ
jgi:large subunit ribosomal protein L32e